MSMLTDFFETRSSVASAHPRDPVLADYFGARNNSAGINVSPDTAMGSAAVYVCVRVLQDTMGTLPCQLFRRLSDGSKVKADKHPLYKLAHRRPNRWQTPAEFRSIMTRHAALRGAGYARKVVRMDGERALVPMHPDRTRIVQREDTSLAYEYFDEQGKRLVLLQDEVLRIPYLTRDGVEPVSPIRLHAETVAQSLLSKTYTNTFLRNGGRPPGYIKFEQTFKDPAARKRFKDQLKEQIAGEGRGSTLVLEGADYKPIGVTNDDAQLLDIIKASLLDVCRMYRMPPHMAGDLERATWGNIEHQQIAFVVHTMGYWVTIWEQAMSRDLLSDAEQDEYFFEFNLAALLRGDSKTQAANFLAGRQGGWLSINDIRDMLNMNRIENGNDYLQPLNFTPVGTKPDEKEPSDGN